MTKTPPPAGGKGSSGTPNPGSPKRPAGGPEGEADGKVESGLPNHGSKGG